MSEQSPSSEGGGPGALPPFGEGFRWEGDDPETLARVVEAAFDYRGDVTILLGGGAALVGFLANRDPAGPEPKVLLLPADGSAPKSIPYRSIRGIAFTGKDTASGKSWESWVRRYEASRQARARGETVGEIGLFPDPFEEPET